MPTTEAEKNAALGPYRVPVGVCLSAVSTMIEAAGSTPLDRSELADGTEVWAGVCYEEGAQLSFKMLAAFWMLTVSVPRVTGYLSERRRDKLRVVSSTSVQEAQTQALAAQPSPSAPVHAPPPVEPLKDPMAELQRQLETLRLEKEAQLRAA